MNPDAKVLADELADAVARGDVGRIVTTVETNLWILVQAHWALVLTVIAQLPDDLLQTKPILAIIKGFGTSAFLAGGGINDHATSTGGGEGPGLPDQLLDTILLQQMMAHRIQGDLGAAKGVADQLRARIERSDDQGRRPIHEMVGFYLLHVGITEALAGNLDQALRDFSNARILRPKSGDDITEYDALLKSAVAQAALGRLVEAERSLRLAGPPPELSEPFLSQLAATGVVARALIAVERLDPAAPDLVARALEQNAGEEMWPFALIASTRWSIGTGDLVGAIDQVDQVVAAGPVPRDSLLGRTVVLTRAQALAMMGEFGAALRALDQDRGPGTGSGMRDEGVPRTRLAFYTEGPEAALTAARQLAVRSGLGPSARAETMLLAAWAQTALLGMPDGATAGPLGALIARERLWRILQLVPERVAVSIPGLDAAPAFERQLVHRDPTQSVRLTANELEIVQLLAGVDSLSAIAKRRFVSPNTVKTQVTSIYRRLGVHSRREAVVEAARRGLLGRPVL